jgi:hypothetical protein
MAKDPASLRPSWKRSGYEHYVTEPQLVTALTDFVLPDIGIGPDTLMWEPAAGEGPIVAGLEQRGHAVIASDIAPRSANVQKLDFLREAPPPEMVDGLICTNPPWSRTLLDTFIARCLSLLDQRRIRGVVLLLRLDHMGTKGRAGLIERAAYLRTCNWRPIWIPGTPREGRWPAEWIVWLRDRGGPPIHRALTMEALNSPELPLAWPLPPLPAPMKAPPPPALQPPPTIGGNGHAAIDWTAPDKAIEETLLAMFPPTAQAFGVLRNVAQEHAKRFLAARHPKSA